MLTGKDLLSILRDNKELAYGFYDNNKGFSLKVKSNVKLRKKRVKTFNEISLTESEKRYLEMLKLNPGNIYLEYTIMGYFVLISKVPMNKIKLIPGMVYNPSRGIYDERIRLNFSM